MARRQVLVIVIAAAVGLVVTSACSHRPTRYRLMRFFLDGVPEPGVEPTIGYAPSSESSRFEVEKQRRASNIQLFAHTPYRENRCGGCHSAESGNLIRSLERGLCLNCHASLIADVKYAHGPAAVYACTFCHHYHTSQYKFLLLREPNETCLRCHRKDDLTTGPHHQGIETQTCVNCHDPHGGNDRFFLKQVDQ